MDQITEREIQGFLDRDRIVTLMNRYFATIDDVSGLDAEWARPIFSEDVQVEHRGFTRQGVDNLAIGNRHVREGLDRTFPISTNAQIKSTVTVPTSGLSCWPST
jgi:hypothetical protein